MLKFWALGICLFALSAGSASGAETVLSYRGKLLQPRTGGGVAGVRVLRFHVAGQLPSAGNCSEDFKVLDVSDGAFSLKQAMSQGYRLSRDNRVSICRDASSGALSESLQVNVGFYANGNLEAAYAWMSSDPRPGRAAADAVVQYASIEYHVSLARRVGRLMVDGAE